MTGRLQESTGSRTEVAEAPGDISAAHRGHSSVGDIGSSESEAIFFAPSPGTQNGHAFPLGGWDHRGLPFSGCWLRAQDRAAGSEAPSHSISMAFQLGAGDTVSASWSQCDAVKTCLACRKGPAKVKGVVWLYGARAGGGKMGKGRAYTRGATP